MTKSVSKGIEKSVFDDYVLAHDCREKTRRLTRRDEDAKKGTKKSIEVAFNKALRFT